MAAAGVNWVLAQTWTEGPEQLLEAVKLCYELGMDVNQANSMGVTALHGAANRGSEASSVSWWKRAPTSRRRTTSIGLRSTGRRACFLATHPAEPKPGSIALLTALLQTQGKEVR